MNVSVAKGGSVGGANVSVSVAVSLGGATVSVSGDWLTPFDALSPKLKGLRQRRIITRLDFANLGLNTRTLFLPATLIEIRWIPG